MCFDSTRIFWIWCGQFSCKKRREAKEYPYCFNGYDRDVLDQLPRNICNKFPALLTRRSAISTAVLKDMISCVMHKMNFNAFRSKLFEAHAGARVESEASYTGFKHCMLEHEKGQGSIVKQTLYKFEHSERMYTSARQRDRFSSTSWFIERFHEWADVRAAWHDRQMMMVGGESISGDKPHKVTN